MNTTTPPEDEVKSRTFKEYIATSKEALGVFKWLYKNMVIPESKIHIRYIVIFLFLSIVLQSIQPGAIAFIFEGLNLHKELYIIGGIATFFVSLLLQKLVMRYHDRAREFILGLHMGRIDDVITANFFDKSLAQHAHQAHILSPTTIDKGKWKALEMQRVLLFDGTSTVMNLSISLICLFILSWIAGAIMLFVILCYVGGSLFLNNRIANVCTPLDKQFRKINRRRAERMEQVQRVVSNGKEKYEVDTLSNEFKPLIAEDRKFWFWFIDVALIRSAINVTGFTGVISIGAWMVWKGDMSIGLLFPLSTWATKVSENVWKLGEIEYQINWNMAAVQSMIKAISIAPEMVESADAVDIDPMIPHTIEFHNVCHTYPQDTTDGKQALPAINGISFTIAPGEKVSLLGPSGSGKTTIMKKLLRFSNPSSGFITIDGINLTNITRASWSKGIGYIPQQAQILDGTIRYNLVYGLSVEERKLITDEELWVIMRRLRIDFGERLTQGLDTVVGKNGVKLSGGQAQRLMIGAAVIKKPWLLIVDEATSSLDSTTEREVQEGLEKVLEGQNTSVLVVTHRLSTVRNMCTKHIMLKPVVTVENGDSQIDATAPSFESLAKQSVLFRQLAADQGIAFA